jgi:uncharacterized membrane protein
MNQLKKDTLLHKAFFATIIVNGGIAVADMAVGLLFVFQKQITSLLFLSSNPLLQKLSVMAATISSQNQSMGILYFFSHGIVKLVLVWGLLTNRLWAYPFAIVVLSAFILYQLYDIILDFSLFTLFLMIVNGITIFFISREYKRIVVQ